MTFYRVVEVFPPVLEISERPNSAPFDEKVAKFLEDVGRIKDCADLVLVAGMRVPGRVALSTTSAATLLERHAGVKAAPVIVARDSNRREVSSTILGALSEGLESIMLVWGDRGERGDPKDVYDFPTLSDMIVDARMITIKARKRCRLFAPVNLDLLRNDRGVRLAKSRLEAGADLLLAQPPTTDADGDLQRHLSIIDAVGLRDRVLLSVFPFKNRDDVLRTEARFGWRLPNSLERRAASRGFDPIEDSRALVRRLRMEGLPGVYLSTRGSPEVAKRVLGGRILP